MMSSLLAVTSACVYQMCAHRSYVALLIAGNASVRYTLWYDKQCGIYWFIIVTDHDLIGEFTHWEIQDSSNRKYQQWLLEVPDCAF